jgi:hypothetical protein
VYFDWGNPSDAVLERGFSGSCLFDTVSAMPFNVFMIVLLAQIVEGFRNSRANRIAGGVRLLEEGFATRARLPRWTAFNAGMMALGGSSLLAVILTQFCSLDLSVDAVIATWCGILGGSALIFVWRRWRIQSGAEDLVLDPGSRLLTLPRTFGRREAMVVPFSDVKALAVTTFEHRSKNKKKGVTYTWAPTVEFKDNRKAEKLADWDSREKAIAFAAWLGEKSGLPLK